MLVFDVTIKETFQKVEKWVEELRIFNKDIDIVVAANKSDVGNFDIDKDEINSYCQFNILKSFRRKKGWLLLIIMKRKVKDVVNFFNKNKEILNRIKLIQNLL